MTHRENPCLPPNVHQKLAGNASKNSAIWGIAVLCSLILVPVYLLVFVASLVELLGVRDVLARGASDYWRHASASMVFLGICGAALFLARRGHPAAKWLIIASPVLLIVLVYPGLNVVWNTALSLFSSLL